MFIKVHPNLIRDAAAIYHPKSSAISQLRGKLSIPSRCNHSFLIRTRDFHEKALLHIIKEETTESSVQSAQSGTGSSASVHRTQPGSQWLHKEGSHRKKSVKSPILTTCTLQFKLKSNLTREQTSNSIIHHVTRTQSFT